MIGEQIAVLQYKEERFQVCKFKLGYCLVYNNEIVLYAMKYDILRERLVNIHKEIIKNHNDGLSDQETFIQ